MRSLGTAYVFVLSKVLSLQATPVGSVKFICFPPFSHFKKNFPDTCVMLIARVSSNFSVTFK